MPTTKPQVYDINLGKSGGAQVSERWEKVISQIYFS